ncbi:MAG: SpoIID/LytB domain-containing protein [Clostridia bacterium]|nr:SpoIID/LytB domain-containing protein [Clostridia bacterium]
MYKRLLTIPLIVYLLLGMVFSPFPAAADSSLASAPLTMGNTQNGMVRVRLSSLGNPSKLNLTVYGSYSINGQVSRTLGNGAAVTVQFNSSTGQLTLTANGSTSSMGSAFRLCRHESGGQSGIKIAQGRVPGNLYPGDFQFTAQKSSAGYTLYVVAYIYMEDYLYGVLPYEMGNASGLEALKAQAVAARTYTMRAMKSSSLYDVVDTTADQIYSGTPSGSANCKAAVDATKGIVVKNGSSFTATYYTASNGGQTESIKNAWGTGGLSYLGVKDDPYDLANPDSRKVSFTVKSSGAQSSKLGSLLNQKAAAIYGSGAAVTAVTAVWAHTPKYAAPSRLYTKLSFDVQYTRNGVLGWGTLTFDIFSELENALSMNITSGSNELWSVTQSGDAFTVTARRYGHGIGMSQRGAMYMAQMGYTYDQILAFYYEGCNRVEYTLTRSILGAIGSSQEGQEQWITELPVALETPSPAENAQTARVTTPNGSLNLRQRASTSAKVLCTIPQNEVISVLDRGSEWCQTAYNGYTGYVMTKFLSFGGESPAAAPTAAPAQQPGLLYAQVTTPSGSLNLRYSAKATAKVLRTIPQNETILILEKGTSWCKVSYAGTTGYVMSQYLAFPGDAPAPLPTAAPQPVPLPSSSLAARVVTPSGSLNLRYSAKATAKVLRTIPQNDLVAVLQKGPDWCQVAYAGTIGYVMTKYLSFDTSASIPTAAPAVTAPPASNDGLRPLDMPILARIMPTSSSLNLRDGCSTGAIILMEMPKFDTLIITAVGDTWCAVNYNGLSGYCMTKYLEFEWYE